MLAVDRVCQRNYWLAKLIYKFWLWRDRKSSPILVYNMGKVGSTSIIYSLSSLKFSRPVYQCHWLVHQNLKRAEKRIRSNANKLAKSSLPIKPRPYYIWTGQYYADKVKSLHGSGEKWDVVSLVRDPVARNLSSFFQNIDSSYGYDLKKAAAEKPLVEILEELWVIFDKNYILAEPNAIKDNDPTSWFDIELREALNIDVYSDTFPIEQGYSIIENDHVRLLLLRMEDLNRCAKPAFFNFMGIMNFNLQKGNVGEDKYYAQVYKEFLKHISIPDTYVNKLYNSQYCKHFYTPAELESFKHTWCKVKGPRLPISA